MVSRGKKEAFDCPILSKQHDEMCHRRPVGFRFFDARSRRAEPPSDDKKVRRPEATTEGSPP